MPQTRKCEECGHTMQPGQSRREHPESGKLVGPCCHPDGKGEADRPQGWGKNSALAATSAASVSALLRRNGFNPLGSGTPRSREGLRVSQSVTGVAVVADLDSEAAAASMSEEAELVMREAGYQVERFNDHIFRVASSMQTVAHDSGDGATIFHCPFCGAGQVTGRSDGTAECGFCHTVFTVQVQPEFPAMPQTIDGHSIQMPGMPGDPTAPGPPGGPENIGEQRMPSDQPEPFTPPGAPEPFTPPQQPVSPGGDGSNGDGKNPVPPQFQKQQARIEGTRFYLTSKGVALPEDTYLRRLAVQFADDRAGVIEAIKTERGAT